MIDRAGGVAFRPLRLVARTAIVLATAGLVFFSTLNAILGNADVAIVFALGAPIGLASWGFARGGNDEAAIALLSFVLIVVITVTLFLSSMGVHDHAVIGYTGVLVVCALTLSRKFFIAMAAFTMVAGTAAFCLEFAGLTHSRLDRLTGWPALVDFFVITAMIGGISRFMAEAFTGSLGAASRDATEDRITAMPNRTGFGQLARLRLKEAASLAGVDALVLADIAGFRRVNQLVGHAAGDRILGEVGRRLAAVDPSLVAARIGDDEFALLGVGLADEAAARTLAERVRTALTFEFSGVSVRAAVGLGCRPRHSGGLDALLMAADEALAATAKAELALPQS